jgi:hypothetical protein
MILLKRANSDLRERRRARTTCERRMTTCATSRELRVNQACSVRRETCDSDGVLHMVQMRGLTTGEQRRTTWARQTMARCDNDDEARHDTMGTCWAALGEVGDRTRRSSSPRCGLQGRRTLLDGLLGRGFGRSPWVGAEATPAGSDRGSHAQGAGVASRAALRPPCRAVGCRGRHLAGLGRACPRRPSGWLPSSCVAGGRDG